MKDQPKEFIPFHSLSQMIFIIGMVIIFCGGCEIEKGLVTNMDEFNEAVQYAQPGDQIILANGVWKDAELVFAGQGTEEAPIRLTVQEKGKVTLEGHSNLQMSGEHLIVEGLVFKNGYTETKEVISMRTSKDALCNHCRLTECVIDNYNNPERFESDLWVSIYGKNNRIDHNYLTGKRNHGVTMAVRMNTEESRENNHLIDHNYFGHHPILGSNGGETLRIGTSHYSMSNSNTIVESNYFDRCNGEHEIISNKACQTTYRQNTFFECQGTLTMRHGNETLVEDNYFFGNGKSNTGGIRIINETQTVRNNYCEGLTGYRFRGALVIMNGVPNSPLNRYFQVKDSEASNNTYINCDHIQLCAGSDEERSATPINSVVSNNLFYHEGKQNIFTVYDDISGISFEGNVVGGQVEPLQENGFQKQSFELVRNENGILIPQGEELAGKGMQDGGERATPENTGVDWYPIKEEEVFFRTGKVITVVPGTNTLLDAVNSASSGDQIHLSPGEYVMTKSISVSKPISIAAIPGGSEKPTIYFQRTSLFNIENGGSLTLENLVIDGKEAPDAHGNNVIRTSRYSMNRNYKLFIEGCDFQDLDVNHTFSVVRVYKSTFADSIVLRNSTFADVDGNVLALNEENEDIGIYNAENVVIEKCRFDNVSGTVLNLYRGGRDESTFGPMLLVDQCTFKDVGNGQRNKAGASIAIHGVQVAHIQNSDFNQSAPIQMHLVVGEPITEIRKCNFNNTGQIISNDPAFVQEQLVFN
jgi:poly(beta-D-mannuronate) lyase